MTELHNTAHKAHPLYARLKQSGIDEIVIIDDAYDAPTLRDVPADGAANFLKAVRVSTSACTALANIREVNEAAQIDDDLISSLWEARRTGIDNALRALVDEHLFKSKLQQREDVDTIRDHLHALGFDPKVIGAQDELPTSARLVFLDYVLDPAATMGLDELATKKAIALYEAAEAGSKPFIVLMSDREGAESQQETFRSKSSLLGGLFGFISKADATVGERLYLKLGSWGVGNSTHHDLQRLVTAIVDALEEAKEAFKARVLALSVQDYAFIQRLSLHEEGQPLGEYLLWLFEASLGYELRDHPEVKKAQDKLDVMRFEKYLPCQNPPSTRLAEFYLSALTEPAIKKMQPHPDDPEGKVPLLGLGDIFVRDKDASVLMVVSAACDLIFAPLADRKCDPSQPVYLLPGELQPISKRNVADSKIRTELILYDGKPHRILWNYARVESRPLRKVRRHFNCRGYERRWRLRLPYALLVQQAFANHLTRIGMPVPPPIFEQADVEVYCSDANEQAMKIGDLIRDGVVLIHGREGDHFILTVECANLLMQRLEKVAEQIESKINKLDGTHKFFEKKKQGIIDAAKKVRAKALDIELWVSLLEKPENLPLAGQKNDLDPTLMWVYRDAKIEGQYPTSVPICLNIVSPLRAKETDVEPQQANPTGGDAATATTSGLEAAKENNLK